MSDLHIDTASPEITAQLLSVLGGEARDAAALYILGDLFESWIGDDAADSSQTEVVEGIKSLTASGVPCFVMHGNRDFLLGERFCNASGAYLLPDPVIVSLYGERVLVMHGDALCTDDRAYQRLRATVRHAEWQRQFMALTVAARRALAGAARDSSRQHTAAVAETITDVNPESVAAALRASGTSTLLHGHTHRPAIHPLSVDGRPCTRIVLGDWHTQGSILTWDHTGPELRSLARPSESGTHRRRS